MPFEIVPAMLEAIFRLDANGLLVAQPLGGPIWIVVASAELYFCELFCEDTPDPFATFYTTELSEVLALAVAFTNTVYWQTAPTEPSIDGVLRKASPLQGFDWMGVRIFNPFASSTGELLYKPSTETNELRPPVLGYGDSYRRWIGLLREQAQTVASRVHPAWDADYQQSGD